MTGSVTPSVTARRWPRAAVGRTCTSPCNSRSRTWSRGRASGSRSCGSRRVPRAVDSVPVTIPAGVDTGAQIRVPGEGSAGPFGGPRGDLIVSTRVQEHPFFGRKGESVHCEVPIGVWEAILGARIQVPTPSGEGVLVLPPGATGGQVFRLRGQGLPKLSGESTGDLYRSEERRVGKECTATCRS